MATHSSTLAWKIPWTEKPGRPQSMGSQRVRHDRAASLSRSVLGQWFAWALCRVRFVLSFCLFVCFPSGGQGWVRWWSCLLMLGFGFLFGLLFRWGICTGCYWWLGDATSCIQVVSFVWVLTIWYSWGLGSGSQCSHSKGSGLALKFWVVLYILFHWSGTPVCSQLLFCMHFCVWRYILMHPWREIYFMSTCSSAILFSQILHFSCRLSYILFIAFTSHRTEKYPFSLLKWPYFIYFLNYSRRN